MSCSKHLHIVMLFSGPVALHTAGYWAITVDICGGGAWVPASSAGTADPEFHLTTQHKWGEWVGGWWGFQTRPLPQTHPPTTPPPLLK